jgi:hypothetical protein
MNLFDYLIQYYGTFTVNINLRTFTVSAAERYKDVIEMFCKDCLKSETRYGQKMTKMCIYNSPGMIENFTKIFLHLLDPHVRNSIVLYGKDESDELIRILLS